MKRYWFQFNLESYINPPPGIKLGCGVTAISKDDALVILKEKVFIYDIIPPVLSVIEDIDISTLDANHIIPNMTSPIKRGIWFPLGYQ